MSENRDRVAFPIVGDAFDDKHKGLTKREYFAAMALQGLIASDKIASTDIYTAAEYAIGFADELLKQLGE